MTANSSSMWSVTAKGRWNQRFSAVAARTVVRTISRTVVRREGDAMTRASRAAPVAALAAGTMIAQQVAAKATRDALHLTTYTEALTLTVSRRKGVTRG